MLASCLITGFPANSQGQGKVRENKKVWKSQGKWTLGHFGQGKWVWKSTRTNKSGFRLITAFGLLYLAKEKNTILFCYLTWILCWCHKSWILILFRIHVEIPNTQNLKMAMIRSSLNLTLCASPANYKICPRCSNISKINALG